MDQAEGLRRFELTDRVVILTGGGGLLGASHAQALAGAGARVVVADIDLEAARQVAEQVRRAGRGEALAVEVDVSQPDSVEAMAAQVDSRYSRIDVLVNNAAIDPKFDRESAGAHSSSFEDFPLDLWQASLAVNVTGMFLASQAVARRMVQVGSGHIINIASTYGLVGPDQRLYEQEKGPPRYKPVTYSVSKAAAIGLTRYLAAYYAGTGIRVNALTPGGVFAGHDEEFVQRYATRTVLGRMARAEEISSALLFLASDASSYMTGANLVVDGGWTAW